MPVFAGFVGGAGVFMGPTGGFLAGYIPASLLGGWLADMFFRRCGSRTGRFIISCAVSAVMAALIHLCGVLWYMVVTGQDISQAAAACVLPFLLPETGKIAAAAFLGIHLHGREYR